MSDQGKVAGLDRVHSDGRKNARKDELYFLFPYQYFPVATIMVNQQVICFTIGARAMVVCSIIMSFKLLVIIDMRLLSTNNCHQI